MTSDIAQFNIVEASIQDHQQALDSGLVTSVELVVRYLIRIATYDIRGGLNAFTLFNPKVFKEAQASDDRRAAGQSLGPLDGVPYTLKDSYKYEGLTVTNGSPALEGLMSSEDSFVAAKFRAAGAVMIGKTNMPPMACGGMQRGLYARAESPYNPDYLTAAFSSGSSNGAGTSTAASMAVFGMGSETVSSGRSPASNNALVAYTPSRGILSCRGLWPLYATCDVPVPYARSVKDMLEILAVISVQDQETSGDFWRDQQYVKLPTIPKVDYPSLAQAESFKGKRIGVPKIYIGEKDSHPNAKLVAVNPQVVELWKTARSDLEALGAEVIPTNFPLVTNYEDDSISKEANNVVGAVPWWNGFERGELVAKVWDDFLKANHDPRLSSFIDIDPYQIFPKPEGYVPDIFGEAKNFMNYPALIEMAKKYRDTSLYELPGMEQTLKSLEAQRKRDLEDWMDTNKLDFIVFPSAADVGKADLETNIESARHALQNGVKYSNGNRAIRHLGVPTVSVTMGKMSDTKMPVNLTFAGKAYSDDKLLKYAYTFEQKTLKRTAPPSTPALPSDYISRKSTSVGNRPRPTLTASAEKKPGQGKIQLTVSGTVESSGTKPTVEVYVDGQLVPGVEIQGGEWKLVTDYESHGTVKLSCLLEPMPAPPAMVVVMASCEGSPPAAKLLWM